MRVYQLAEKWKTSSSELLRHVRTLGLEISSPLSQVDADDARALETAFKGGTDGEAAKQTREAARAAKRAKVAARRLEELAAARPELEATRQRAIEMDALAHGKSVKAEEPAPAPAPVEVPAPTVETPTPQAEPAPVQPQPAAPAPAPAPAEKAPEAAPPAPAPAPAKKPAEPPKPAPAAPAKPAAAKAPARPARSHYEEEDELDDIPLSSSNRDRLSRGESSKDFAKPPRPASRERGGRDSHATQSQQRGNAARGGDSRAAQRPAPGRSGDRFQGRDRDRDNGGRLPPRPLNAQQQAGADQAAPVDDHVIALRGAIVVKDLAERLGIRPNRLIADLMQLNILASINQHVEPAVAEKIAVKYGFKVEMERPKRSLERRPVLRSEDADDEIPEDKPEDLLPRPPVVTFLGHVDHGKTSLMDRIRHTKVASGEAGGITQHIGAYTVELSGRKITFLDTPGHAAFSAMRLRGATLTDIAVIIIAADDGVMPQTREAIAAARQAGVQIMVAINKCDLPTAKPDRVRQMLQGEGLTPEEWGGDVICVEVSAHTGDGIDTLLEMILLQADMLELRANPNRRADGYVVEAQLEPGLGPTASILVTGGTLHVGDILLCGEYFGKVRGLIDDRGRRVKSVGPSTAVKCMGLSGVPEAGARFRVMLNEKRARELAAREAEARKLAALSTSKATSLDALMRQMTSDQKKSLSVIVKADTQGSSEAICEMLRGIVSQKVSLEILSESIGNVSATDVNNAAAGKAIIVGFNVGCESGVQQQARHDGVRINTFRIIYELQDYVKQCMLDLLPPEYKEVVKGHAEIRAFFDIGKTGRIAGCQLLDGMLTAKGYYRIFRKKEQLWTGKLLSLKHFQNEVSEVTGSQECGIHFNGFEGFLVGDTVECYTLEELPRSL